jgi:RNA-directed DNA polymerase
MSTNKIVAWNDIDWTKVRRNVRRKQYRIFKAKKLGKKQTVRKLQIRLINSWEAKVLSVLRVTTLNKGKKTAGVDKQIVSTPDQKMKLALSLSLDGKASPIRIIPKPGKTELRPLGIPTIKDRAKQHLALLALEPEWECVFEPNSYGFRTGRSCQDAIEAIFLCLHHKRVKHVFDADIAKCFDRIDHEALLAKLDTFPKMTNQIRAWLKADIMLGYVNRNKGVLSSTSGTPQGGIISPLLANIALHGLENHLKNFVSNIPGPISTGNEARGKLPKRKALGIVRYADDFVLIHENQKTLKLCIAETGKWLAGIGLEMSAEKSRLRDSRNGFQFLGFQISMVRRAVYRKQYKVKIIPSAKSCQRLLTNIRSVLIKAKAWSAYSLISALRPKVIGWANYFRFSECKKTFLRLTNSIFGMIRAWVFRRDPRHGRRLIKQKYFPSGRTYVFDYVSHQDNWILVGSQKGKKGRKRENFLPHIVWVVSRKFVKVKETNTPFDPSLKLYWLNRMATHSYYPESIKF